MTYPFLQLFFFLKICTFYVTITNISKPPKICGFILINSQIPSIIKIGKNLFLGINLPMFQI